MSARPARNTIQQSKQEVKNAKLLAGPALWGANVVEESRLHFNRHSHAKPGRWREHGDLQRDQWGAPGLSALSASGATCDGLVRQQATGNPRRHHFLSEFCGLARSEQNFPGNGWCDGGYIQPHWKWRA